MIWRMHEFKSERHMHEYLIKIESMNYIAYCIVDLLILIVPKWIRI